MCYLRLAVAILLLFNGVHAYSLMNAVHHMHDYFATHNQHDRSLLSLISCSTYFLRMDMIALSDYATYVWTEATTEIFNSNDYKTHFLRTRIIGADGTFTDERSNFFPLPELLPRNMTLSFAKYSCETYASDDDQVTKFCGDWQSTSVPAFLSLYLGALSVNDKESIITGLCDTTDEFAKDAFSILVKFYINNNYINYGRGEFIKVRTSRELLDTALGVSKELLHVDPNLLFLRR